MDKRKVVVGCNILTSIDSIVYPNHCQMWYRFGRDYKDLDFYFSAPRRCSIDNMRNVTIDFAIKQGAEFVFFYDDDVIVPNDALIKLIAVMDIDSNVAVASGLTYIRKYPYKPMLFKAEEDGLYMYEDFKDKVDDSGVLTEKLGAVGFSCALIRVEYLKNLRPPYCITGSQNTEDVYLCQRIRDHYENAVIACDTTIDTSHLVDKYYVNAENVDDLRKYEELLNKARPDDGGDRGQEYAENIESRFRETVGEVS